MLLSLMGSANGEGIPGMPAWDPHVSAPPEITNSTSRWTTQDLHAAATCQLDQAGSGGSPPASLAALDPVMQAGAAIYTAECSACHTMNGAGIAQLLPALKGSQFVQQVNAE